MDGALEEHMRTTTFSRVFADKIPQALWLTKTSLPWRKTENSRLLQLWNLSENAPEMICEAAVFVKPSSGTVRVLNPWPEPVAQLEEGASVERDEVRNDSRLLAFLDIPRANALDMVHRLAWQNRRRHLRRSDYVLHPRKSLIHSLAQVVDLGSSPMNQKRKEAIGVGENRNDGQVPIGNGHVHDVLEFHVIWISPSKNKEKNGLLRRSLIDAWVLVSELLENVLAKELSSVIRIPLHLMNFEVLPLISKNGALWRKRIRTHALPDSRVPLARREILLACIVSSPSKSGAPNS
jgi:hypothetical protein